VRRLYQTEWHNIPLESVGAVSSTELADASFYASFYEMFFKRYNKPEDLDPSWIELKMQTAGFLSRHDKFNTAGSVLSIGCGLGITEKALIDKGFFNIEVTEISPEPLRWLRPYISAGNVHIGLFPSCLPDHRCYDFILLPSVDYFFDQDGLIDFLKAVKGRLSSGGVCLLISWSYEFSGCIRQAVGIVKKTATVFLEKANIRKRGQFWGYLRNRKDYRYAMEAAGFVDICDGLLEKKTRWDTYWIEGNKH